MKTIIADNVRTLPRHRSGTPAPLAAGQSTTVIAFPRPAAEAEDAGRQPSDPHAARVADIARRLAAVHAAMSDSQPALHGDNVVPLGRRPSPAIVPFAGALRTSGLTAG